MQPILLSVSSPSKLPWKHSFAHQAVMDIEQQWSFSNVYMFFHHNFSFFVSQLSKVHKSKFDLFFTEKGIEFFVWTGSVQAYLYPHTVGRMMNHFYNPCRNALINSFSVTMPNTTDVSHHCKDTPVTFSLLTFYFIYKPATLHLGMEPIQSRLGIRIWYQHNSWIRNFQYKESRNFCFNVVCWNYSTWSYTPTIAGFECGWCLCQM